MNKVFPNPIMLALDTSSLDEAKSLACKIKRSYRWYKTWDGVF